MDKMIFTVKEVSEIIHTNQTYVYSLIKSGLLPALKLGSYKIRKETLAKFLEDYEGCDLTNPFEYVYNKQAHSWYLLTLTITTRLFGGQFPYSLFCPLFVHQNWVGLNYYRLK